jgi:hypothetical protein
LRAIKLGDLILTGTVSLVAGFNVVMSGAVNPSVDGGVFGATAQLDGVPGAGLGRTGGCPDTGTINTINGIGPDASGNFTLGTDDCFRSQLPLTVAGRHGTYGTGEIPPDVARAAVQLYNDCTPCCTCDEFVRTYKGLKHVWDQYQAIALAATTVRDTYVRNRDRWLAQLDCRTATPLRAVASPEPSCSAFVAGLWCNMSKCCVPNPELRFTLQTYTNGVLDTFEPAHLQVFNAFISSALTIDTDLGYVPIIYTRLDGGPVISFHLGLANPQQTIVAKFRVHFTCDATRSLKVTVTAHAPNPPPNPAGVTCTLPTPAVPADIAAIWVDAAVPAATMRAIATVTIPMNPNPPAFTVLL